MSKKITYLFLALAVGFAARSQQVKFAGTADKKFEGSKIVLYNRATNDHDSAFVKDGKFAFTLSFKEPTIYMFYSEYEMKAKGGYAPYGIMVTEPGTVKIDADIPNFSESKVSGAKENDLYKKFSSESGKAQQKIMDDL